MLNEKIYHVVATPESGLIKAYGIAEAKVKAWIFLQACYGNSFNILAVIDVSDRDILRNQYLTNQLI